MNSKQKVLVVGTTTDYIDWIRQDCPGRALFLTDAATRDQAVEKMPHPSEEVLADLEDSSGAMDMLLAHLQKWNMSLNGIACFDCESMELAALLAEKLSLPYPTVESIRVCRDKYASKILWKAHSVSCPRVRLVQSPDGIDDFRKELRAPCVIKPLSGSGSELVFVCRSKKDCDKWGTVLQEELKRRENSRLFSRATSWFLAEEMIQGDEYSCDFIIRNTGVDIIRLTKKIHARNRPFGTVIGYALCPYPSTDFNFEDLESALFNGAKALGISNAICMVDFMETANGAVLLEMTPRPGGDCIPHLLRRSGLRDSLLTALDFAQQRPVALNRGKVNGQYVGLRLHAGKNGEISSLDTKSLQADPRTREINMIRSAGHHVTMPPHDYESWYLGYVIFEPVEEIDVVDQCHDLGRSLIIETCSDS